MIHAPLETWCPVLAALAASSQHHASSVVLLLSAATRSEAVYLTTRMRCPLGCSTDKENTHWRCWPETRPSPRSSTSPRGRGAPSPSWPGRWPGSPGDSRPWSKNAHWCIWPGLDMAQWHMSRPVKGVWSLVPPRTADCGLGGAAAECQHQEARHQGAWSRPQAVQHQTHCSRLVAEDWNSSSNYALSYLEQ